MTMKYRTPETVYADVEAPDDLGAFIRNLGPSTFKKPEYRRRTVGAFGELEGGPGPAVQYRLPDWFSAEALQRLSVEQLESYKTALEQQRKSYEQARGSGPQYEDDQYKVMPQNIDPGSMAGREELLRMGYRAVEGNSEDNGSTTFWLAPGGHQEAYDAAQAFQAEKQRELSLFDELGAAIQRARDVRSQERQHAKNQLYGGIARLGYQFAPGSLGDASVREEIWNARDYLPQFLRGAARDRRFVRGPGDTGDFTWSAPRPMFEGVEDVPYEAPYEPQMGEMPAVFEPPAYRPGRPVFEAPRAAPRPLADGMELRPGVRVRNPFEESVRRLGPRPSRGMFS